MAHQPTNVQDRVAAPVALTEQELQTAMSTSTIRQRISDVSTIARATLNVDYSDPILLTKAFEMFQISTHNIHNIDYQSPHEMRNLFSAAQTSLQCLQACILTRLGFAVDDIKVDVLEEQYTTLQFESVKFKLEGIALLRLTMLTEFYAEIVKAQKSLSDMPQVQQAIRITLGEAVRYYQESSASWANLELLSGADLQNPFHRVMWKGLMFNFATAILLMMAKSVGDKFGGCIVELLGTKIPPFGFAFE
jgi:hypothetical protein